MESLLFIPDISGFTEFVNHTETEHSRHIISELLELIIDADELGLEVAEVEGDAVFFFSEDSLPSAQEIADQARTTFVRFHEHLKLYENRRICHCGACKTAQSLTLKFVAHRGDIDFLNIRGRRKPHGSDVILVHRLLKNSIDHSEYLLATPTVFGDSQPESWAEWSEGQASYDSFGDVAFCHASLADLHASVADPPPLEAFPLIQDPVVVHGRLALPQEEAFELVSNLRLRGLWNDEADEIRFETDRVNRVGTAHQCVIDGKLLDFETVHHDFGDGSLTIGERGTAPPFVQAFAAFWVLERDGTDTRTRVEVHYEKPNGLVRLAMPLFKTIVRRKMAGSMRQLEQAATKLASPQVEPVFV